MVLKIIQALVDRMVDVEDQEIKIIYCADVI